MSMLSSQKLAKAEMMTAEGDIVLNVTQWWAIITFL